MENALQSFLLVLAVYVTMREVSDPDATPWSSAVFLGVALTDPIRTALKAPSKPPSPPPLRAQAGGVLQHLRCG
jgi:hypothetical protein